LLAKFNPVTYAVDLLRGVLLGNFNNNPLSSVLILSLIFIICFGLSTLAFEKGDDL